jgi:hypothetical protein
MNKTDYSSDPAIPEDEIEALVEALNTSPCISADRWLMAIIGGESLSEEESLHLRSCQHCQRSRHRWIAARDTENPDLGPEIDPGQDYDSPLTEQDVRDWIGQMLPTQMHSMVQAPSFLLGGTAQTSAFRALSPVGTAVRAERPVLEWNPCLDAVYYRIEVFTTDADGVPDDLVASAKDLVSSPWQPPHALPRGRRLQWWVFAHDAVEEIAVAPDPAEASAFFSILTDAQAAELEVAEARVRDSPIERAFLLLGFGLRDEATEQFRALVETDPDSSEAQVAELWLNYLQATRDKG